MRHFYLTLAAGVLAIGGLAGFTQRATAQDPWHDRYHDDLEHREFHRQLEHRDIHRYPMTWWQHEQLHDQLDHDRFHDYLEHRQIHRDYYGGPYYSPYQSYGYSGSYYQPSYGYLGNGIGFQGRRFSIYFGR
jgi:hypothetical protein